MARRNRKRTAEPSPSPSAEQQRTRSLWIHSAGEHRFTTPWESPLDTRGWTRRAEVRLVGKDFAWHLHPDDVSKLPPDVLAGTPSQQSYCLGGPRLIYVDRTRRCRTCGQAFLFSAAEQKYWYETLRFWTDSEAVDCLACRRSVRVRRAAQREHQRAAAAAQRAPQDAAAQLALARSTVVLFEATGGADLDAGIAAARAAGRFAPTAASTLEALYWEGRLQQAAGRDGRALFQRFVHESAKVRRRGISALVSDAQKRLAAADAASAP